MQVFYNSKREAEADGYTDYKQGGGHPPQHPTVGFWLTQFDSGSQVNKHGQIHSFGGLRCDAKRLFNDIRKGQDSRVRLFQARFPRVRTLPSGRASADYEAHEHTISVAGEAWRGQSTGNPALRRRGRHHLGVRLPEQRVPSM